MGLMDQGTTLTFPSSSGQAEGIDLGAPPAKFCRGAPKKWVHGVGSKGCETLFIIIIAVGFELQLSFSLLLLSLSSSRPHSPTLAISFSLSVKVKVSRKAGLPFVIVRGTEFPEFREFISFPPNIPVSLTHYSIRRAWVQFQARHGILTST
jgi:hypothetical protein